LEISLQNYLDENKDYFSNIEEVKNGVYVKFLPDLANKNTPALSRLINEMHSKFKADWKGSLFNGVFVPSLVPFDERLTCILTERSCRFQGEKAVSVDSHSETLDQEMSEVENHLLKLRNYFKPTISPEEIQKSIAFLLEKGLSPIEIAAKTGSSKATIYRLAGKKASVPLTTVAVSAT
jgi:hypothetical protein